jgi:hypothetical protein
MHIEAFLAANARFKPIDLLIPEDCALCELDQDDDDLYHIYMEDGHARIEMYES